MLTTGITIPCYLRVSLVATLSRITTTFLGTISTVMCHFTIIVFIPFHYIVLGWTTTQAMQLYIAKERYPTTSTDVHMQ